MMDFKDAIKLPVGYAVAVLALALVFAFFPSIDLMISGWFYNGETGRFWLEDNRTADSLDFIMTLIPMGFVLACVCSLLFLLLRRRKNSWRSGWLLAYFVLLFAVGPMLVVNYGLKDHWGRARPEAIEQFGGTQEFTPFYLPSDQCETDCSYSSGHTARAFFFMGLAFAVLGLGARVSAGKRYGVLAGVISFGAVAAFLRIAEGKHYASDVLTSAILVTYLAWVFYRWLLADKPKANLD